MQVGDVEAPDARALGDVARVAAHALVAAGAERERALAGEDDHADRRVLAGQLERVGDLDDGLRPEGVAHLRAVDGDLRDAVAAELVADVARTRRPGSSPRSWAGSTSRPHGGRGLAPARRRRAHRDATALVADGRTLTYAELLDAARRRGAPAARARRARRRPRRASRCRPGAEFAVALHACLRLGAVAVPVDLRLGDEERAARAATCAVTVDAPLDGPEADAPLADTHDLDAVAAVVHTSGTTGDRPRGRADVRQLAVERARLGRRARPRPRRALALRAAARARRRPVDPAAQRDLRDDGGRPRRFDTDARRSTALRAARRSSRSSRRRSRGCSTPGCASRRGCAPRCSAAGRSRPRCSSARRRPGVPVAPTYGLTEACSQVDDRRRARCSARAWRSSPAGEILVGGPTVAPGARGDDGLLHTGDLGASTPTAACASPAARPTRSSPAARTSRRRGRGRARGAPRGRGGGGPRAARRRVGRGGRRHRRPARRAPPRPATSCARTCAARLAALQGAQGRRVRDALPRTPSGKLLRRLLA